MKLLVTGRGTSGSWQIRGLQLGAAIGATVHANAGKCGGYDLAIVVKRAPDDLLYRLHTARVPIIYDVVDGWPQPAGNAWTRAECTAWLWRAVSTIKPRAIVAATHAMAADCARPHGLPVFVLPHHARPQQAVNPVRERVQAIGYEGSESHLGFWRTVLEREAKRRGWRFTMNPCSLADLDVVVAVREATGYAARHWKSNVKLANAQGSGTPIICGRESGYTETATGGERWADTPEEMATALDELTAQDARQRAVIQLRPPMLDEVAHQYQTWLAGLKF